MLLQGICDHELLLTDVYAGEVGSLHDYTLYRRSPIYNKIITNNITFYNQSYLAGDLAYTLNINLVVGFKDNGHLTALQKQFNICLSKARVKIENTFALLKGRFRRLKMIETIRLDLVSLFIISACILHNICILNEDTIDDILNINEERAAERENNPNNINDIVNEAVRQNAVAKRNNIMDNLNVYLENDFQ